VRVREVELGYAWRCRRSRLTLQGFGDHCERVFRLLVLGIVLGDYLEVCKDRQQKGRRMIIKGAPAFAASSNRCSRRANPRRNLACIDLGSRVKALVAA